MYYEYGHGFPIYFAENKLRKWVAWNSVIRIYWMQSKIKIVGNRNSSVHCNVAVNNSLNFGISKILMSQWLWKTL